MPRDRRYHGGGGKDLSPLIYGIGEAISPTEENPFYNKKPGDVPYTEKDPEAFLAAQHSDRPFKGFLSSRENTDAAQERLAQEGRTKQEQIRRTQIIAEQAAEDARQYDLNLKRMGQEAAAASTGINSQILGAQQPYSTLANVGLAPTPQTPPLSLVPTMSGAEVAGLIGRGAYGQRGISDYPEIRRGFVTDAATLPYVGPTAGAIAERGALEAGGALDAARSNPKAIIDAALSKYRTPALNADLLGRELDKSKAQAYADPWIPMHEGYTATGPKTGISLTPPTHAGFAQSGTDAKGQPTYGFVPGKPSYPMGMVQLPDGTLVTTGGPPKATPPIAPPPTAPAAGPGFISRSTPSLSLTPSAFNPDPIRARGVIPTGINAMTADLNRSAIEQQSQMENLKQDPFAGLRDIRDFYWMPAGAGEAPMIRHSPLALPPEIERAKRSRGLLPQY